MTTGSRLIGTAYTPYVYYRNWSGGNSTFIQPPGYIRKFVYKGRKKGFQLIYRRPKKVKQLRWNNYTMTGYVGGTSSNYCATNLAYASTEPASFWGANDDIKLLNKLQAQVRGHKFNLGIAVGEGARTVALAKHTVTRFYHAIRALKKGRIDLALRALGVSPAIQGKRIKKAFILTAMEERMPDDFNIKIKKGLKNLRDINSFDFGKQRKLKAGAGWRELPDGSFKADHWRKIPVGPGGRPLRGGEQLTTKDISSMWLEVQYGWKPLLSDVYEAGEAYSSITDKARTTKFKVSARKNYAVSTNIGTTYSRVGTGFRAKSIECRLTEVMSAPRSLGLANPASVAWELLPFSFVVDWFIPIGPYLDALSQIPNLTGTFLSTNVLKQEMFVTRLVTPAKGSKASAKLCTVNRTVSTNLVVPRCEFVAFPDAMSPTHIGSALALLHKVFL